MKCTTLLDYLPLLSTFRFQRFNTRFVQTPDSASLPAQARSAFNRCNLPAEVLGGLPFQRHPVPLLIDGVAEVHRALFLSLDQVEDQQTRALYFRDYMSASFLLDHKERAGLAPQAQRVVRGKADYLRLLRGWMFDADGIEGAVMKRWVESRFGLIPRSHKGPIHSAEEPRYLAYQADYVRGLYNANALEAQLDLLYCFFQYELHRRLPGATHWRLYRGVNQLRRHDVLDHTTEGEAVVLLNNLNSFTSDRHRSCTFGDTILSTDVPLAKLLFWYDLLPGVLQGEQEFLVIGGVYQVGVSR